jgi:SPW repeat
MATAEFNLPKQWEDWTNWVLGIWLCISPWALLFSNDAAATRNAVLVGVLIILAEVVTLSIFQVWEEWISVVLGVWLAISPWVLGITETPAEVDFVIVGLLVLALALYEIWDERRSPGSQA